MTRPSPLTCTRRRTVLKAIGGLTLGGLAATGRAQTFPSRPIRLIISFAPGGPTDLIARTVAKEMSRVLGQAIVPENRPGAAGAIASAAVARADPDGYTLLFHEVAATFAIQPILTPTLPYDVHKDFAPIGLAARGPIFLLVNAQLPVKSVADLVALAKAKPDGLSFGSAGGSGQFPTHIGPELLMIKQGIKAVHVPYKGAAPALVDLAAGRLQFMMTTGTGSAKPFLDRNEIRAIAVTGTKRLETMPNVPTFAESGVPLPELDSGTAWAIFGPRGLPVGVQQAVNKALNESLGAPDLKKSLTLLDIVPQGGSTAELQAMIEFNWQTWPPLLKKMNIETQ